MADVEASVIARLTAEVGPVPVSTRTRPAGAHVLVRRDGGAADHHRLRDNARMNIRAYADTPGAAYALAADVRFAIVRGVVSAGVVWVDVDEQTFARIHDTDRDQPGWMLVVDITCRDALTRTA